MSSMYVKSRIISPFVEHRDRLAGQDAARELEQRHVRAAPRSVHGEEAQAGDRNRRRGARTCAPSARSPFSSPRRARPDDRRCRARRTAASCSRRRPSSTTRTRDARRRVAAAFEDVQEAGDVAVDVRVRVGRASSARPPARPDGRRAAAVRARTAPPSRRGRAMSTPDERETLGLRAAARAAPASATDRSSR